MITQSKYSVSVFNSTIMYFMYWSVLSCSVLTDFLRDQVPLSRGFPRQEYWSGLPFPSPGNLPNLGIELWSPTLQASLYCLSHQTLPFQQLGIKLTIGFSYMPFIKLRKFPSVPSLFSVFIMKRCWILSDAFFCIY